MTKVRRLSLFALALLISVVSLIPSEAQRSGIDTYAITNARIVPGPDQ